MSEQRQSSSSVYVALSLMAFVLLPALYLLSAGPVSMLCETMELDENHPVGTAVHVFYWPLIWLMQNNESFADLMDWYLDYW